MLMHNENRYADPEGNNPDTTRFPRWLLTDAPDRGTGLIQPHSSSIEVSRIHTTVLHLQ